MTTPGPTPFSGMTANDIISMYLNQWNLGSLASQVQGYVAGGLSGDQAYLALTQTNEYKQRFAGNQIRIKNGLDPLSEAQYLSREDSLSQQFRAYGLPGDFMTDQADFAKAIGNNIGGQEMDQRLSAYQAVLANGKDNGVLDYAKTHYGLGDGDMLAYFIDPDRAAPILSKMAAASQIGAAAAQTGFGNVTTADAEKLADMGVSQSQAVSGFNQAAGLKQLTDTVGDSVGVTKDDLENAIFGQNDAAQQKIKQAQDTRTAAFQQGGGFAATNKGIAGLGSAAQ